MTSEGAFWVEIGFGFPNTYHFMRRLTYCSTRCSIVLHYQYHSSKALHIMTPPPYTRNKNLNWKHHDNDGIDDDNLDELQAAMILTHLGDSTTPSATTSNSYDINTTTDDDTTITVFHPVSPTSSITSSPLISSISTTTAISTKKHDRNIITPMLTSSPIELIEVARPAKKIRRRHEVDCSISRRSTTAKPCVFPTINDQEDISFEKTLHSDDDTGKINSAHVHIRREVLEVKRSMSGRVYFQCKLYIVCASYVHISHVCIVY